MRTPDPSEVRRLMTELGVTELVAALLVNRDLSEPSVAKAFLEPRLAALPDPFAMKGMTTAVARIQAALDAREQICVWGDYDVDGVTSASQLITFFRALGVQVRHVVPDRFSEGYGLNAAGVEAVVRGGATLIITVDCGISNVAEVDVANAHGADVIIVDHHQVPPVLPRAFAILNPVQPGCDYPDKRLAACGVTWVLLIALRARLRESGWFRARPEPDLRDYLDLTAIGTVADMVPLIGVNRIITSVGLERVATSQRPGVRALCQVAAIKPERVSAGAVGFHLGPRINAAGRMAHASAGVALMTTESVAEAAQMAAGVDAYNLERRQVQESIFEEAVQLVEDAGDPAARRSIVLARPGWHSGVLGIVASKLVERFHRPTVLLTVEDGFAKGSARSISGFKLVVHLEKLASHLVKYGGHDHAAGMTLEAGRVDAFATAFEEAARASLEERHLTRRLRVDAEVPLEWLCDALYEDTRRLAPYGQGNPEPTFLARGVYVFEARLVGQDKRHVKLRFDGGQGRAVDAIAFGQAASCPAPGDRVDLAWIPELNVFRGEARLEARVKAIRPSD
ncbi:MAG: single-stranded-DNA-specific exonuclease RecJ [Deltaproteobacteria bacterium]|nr:MAG: single-stranded-DNA-specific exonuclease RecJ [Deltaproteobacteria bacterium]